MDQSAATEFISGPTLVEHDGTWACVLCPATFTDPRAGKSHPWAAHQIRSRSIDSIRRRLRRYRAEPTPVPEEEAPPPPPMTEIVFGVRDSQRRKGILDADEVEKVRRRLLFRTWQIAGELAASKKREPTQDDAKAVLDVLKSMTIEQERRPDVKRPRGTATPTFGVLPKWLTRERWLAEITRATLVHEIDALSRELRRTRGAVMDAIRDSVKARLWRKDTVLTTLDDEKQERLMALLRPGRISDLMGKAVPLPPKPTPVIGAPL